MKKVIIVLIYTLSLVSCSIPKFKVSGLLSLSGENQNISQVIVRFYSPQFDDATNQKLVCQAQDFSDIDFVMSSDVSPPTEGYLIVSSHGKILKVLYLSDFQNDSFISESVDIPDEVSDDFFVENLSVCSANTAVPDAEDNVNSEK